MAETLYQDFPELDRRDALEVAEGAKGIEIVHWFLMMELFHGVHHKVRYPTAFDGLYIHLRSAMPA